MFALMCLFGVDDVRAHLSHEVRADTLGQLKHQLNTVELFLRFRRSGIIKGVFLYFITRKLVRETDSYIV